MAFYQVSPNSALSTPGSMGRIGLAADFRKNHLSFC